MSMLSGNTIYRRIKETAVMNLHPKRSNHLARVLSLALVGGAGLMAATEVFAFPVYNCGDPIDASQGSGSAVLQQDITGFTGSGSCFEVKDGKTLNLNGHKIVCATGYTCGQAVICSSSLNANSLITGVSDSVTDIDGQWTAGVQNCGSVKNLKIVGAITGILFDAANNGADFTGNAIDTAAGGTGIDVKIEDSGDSIQNNRITGGNIGIRLAKGRSTANGPYVRYNIIRGAAVAGISSTITINDFFRIESNSIVGGGSGSLPFSIAGTHPTFAGNICEAEALHPGLASYGRCACEVDRFHLDSVGSCPL